MLSHHRVLAYRANRDSIRAARGAPPIWEDSHQSVGATAPLLEPVGHGPFPGIYLVREPWEAQAPVFGTHVEESVRVGGW